MNPRRSREAYAGYLGQPPGYLCRGATELTESVVKEPSRASSNRRARWLLLRIALGRVCRWFVCSVVLASIPILVSFFALPRTSSVTALLSHGDFAVLASALAAASIGELIGPCEPPKWIRNILILSCILLFTSAILLLAGIAGHYARLSPSLDVRFSWISFAIATIVGAASWAATVERPKAQSSNVRRSHQHGDGAGEP